MTQYTVIAKDEYRENVGEPFYCDEGINLALAIDEALAQDGATYVEVYQGSVD